MKDVVSINSQPRSGSTFIIHNLKKILPNLVIEKNPPKNKAIIKDHSLLQIVVIRNPKDKIFSSYSHAEHFYPSGMEFYEHLIRQQVKEYCDEIENFIENKDFITIYDFNDIEWILSDIISTLRLTIPNNFNIDQPQATPDFIPSAKETAFYHKLISLGISDDIFIPANQAYAKIIKLCKKP
jgi:hypothetical protein